MVFDEELKSLTHDNDSPYIATSRANLLNFDDQGNLISIQGPSDTSNALLTQYNIAVTFTVPFERTISNCRVNTPKKGCLLSMNLLSLGDQSDSGIKYKLPQNIQFIYNDSINIKNACELDQWALVAAWVVLLYSVIYYAFKKY